MTIRARLRFPWNTAILAAAVLLTACEDEPPSAEAFCKRASTCEPMDLLVSKESCAQQVDDRLEGAPSECSKCVLGLPCAGMARLAGGKISLSQICPTCPRTVTAPADCAAAHAIICAIALPPASASAAAPPPPAKATPSASASASPSATKPPPPAPLEPLPTETRLQTVPVPALPP